MKNPYLVLALASIMAAPVYAADNVSVKQSEILNRLLASYAEKAKVEFKEQRGRGAVSDRPFTAAEGRKFYLIRRTWQSGDFTCSGCHTDDPRQEGKHIKTHLPIKPLAPSVNPERFIDAQKVEANLTAHCMDLHERDCSAYEKGNFIAYLMSVK